MSKFNMPKLYKHNSFQQMLNEQFQETRYRETKSEIYQRETE